jgi:hypothetical protein
MIQTQPRNTAGIRSGRSSLKPARKDILLVCAKASEVVQFVPAGDKTTLVKMFLSLTGCFSSQTDGTIRYTLSTAAARRVWRRLVRAGYTE